MILTTSVVPALRFSHARPLAYAIPVQLEYNRCQFIRIRPAKYNDSAWRVTSEAGEYRNIGLSFKHVDRTRPPSRLARYNGTRRYLSLASICPRRRRPVCRGERKRKKGFAVT